VTGRLFKKFADLDPTFPVSLEFENGRQPTPRGTLGLETLGGKDFSLVFGERRFRIESVDVRATAVQENMNEVFGLGGKVRFS
jgi:hypothetical protein